MTLAAKNDTWRDIIEISDQGSLVVDSTWRRLRHLPIGINVLMARILRHGELFLTQSYLR